jgi:hypothetical protein
MAETQNRAAPINIRARSTQRNLIDKAAAMLNKNRSDFRHSRHSLMRRSKTTPLCENCYMTGHHGRNKSAGANYRGSPH